LGDDNPMLKVIVIFDPSTIMEPQKGDPNGNKAESKKGIVVHNILVVFFSG
jgi:hypothetical protein